MLYTINASSLDKVQKTFNRYAKKANAIGLNCSLEVVKSYQKRVNVYEYDEINHMECKTGTTIIDVVDVELEYPEYKLGDYVVIGVIEHGENHKNLVYGCSDVKVPSKYYTADGICEHCRTAHKRVNTVILMNADGEFKQVGKSCLKEYTGVTDDSLINAYMALDSILIENDVERGFRGTPDNKYVETFNYLTRCIHVYNTLGYTKDNKYKADSLAFSKTSDSDADIAKKVIEFFNTHEITDIYDYNYEIFKNTKNTLANEFCKRESGFVAYAYPLYLKEVKKLADIEAKKQNVAKYDYFGNEGDKVEIKVTGRCVGSYETNYSYYYPTTTYVYKFIDVEDKHIFIWKTSKSIPTNDEGVFKGVIKGTIKEHGVYGDGNVDEKQTVLTRCKVTESV